MWIREPISLAKSGQMFLPDGGNGVFDVVYIDNFVDAMVLVLSSDKAGGQIFNIGDGNPVTCKEYFGRIAGLAGGKVRTVPLRVAGPVLDLVGGVQRKIGIKNEIGEAALLMLNRSSGVSIEKARTMLGYEPIVSYEEGMRRSEEWARAEGLV